MSALYSTFQDTFTEQKVDYIVGNFLDSLEQGQPKENAETLPQQEQLLPTPSNSQVSADLQNAVREAEPYYSPATSKIDYNENMLLVEPFMRKYSASSYRSPIPSPDMVGRSSPYYQQQYKAQYGEYPEYYQSNYQYNPYYAQQQPQQPQQQNYQYSYYDSSSRPSSVQSERDFPCPVKGCGKMFPSKQLLESHKEQHPSTTLKPFQCTVCNQSFSRSHGTRF
jgi:hypothetical protein